MNQEKRGDAAEKSDKEKRDDEDAINADKEKRECDFLCLQRLGMPISMLTKRKERDIA